MKKGLILRILSLVLILCITTGLTLTVSADYPTPTNNIYDGMGILSDSVIETIRSTNETLYNKHKVKISLCVVESVGDEDIVSYAKAVFSKWRLGEGVLIVISTGDNLYSAVQSVEVADVLTNAQLDSILTEFLEEDFAAGNISHGVLRTVNKLSSFLKTELAEEEKTPAAPVEDTTEKTEGEEEKVTFVTVILSILKILLWTVIILVAFFIIAFVAALFNDNVAELMQKYVFSHFTGSKPANRQDYYDERLYGSPRSGNGRPGQNQNNPNGQRRLPPPGQQYPQQYNGQYNGQQQRGQYNNQYGNPYNNGQQRSNKYQQYGNNGQYGQNSQYTGQQQRRPQQVQQQNNYELTQQYNIPSNPRNTNRRQNGDRY